ncbi:hypothetical protein Cgig2_005180 [Carnegiea gigantea]|uniref:Patellin-3 n=1 Tax=Carnegiea gigantea TaxID=171969 RepID=A0A9Q1KFZ2_9CARY|nr:hypothetical protein Cgig2_005180 [Carnegiea gigantea]
MAEGALKATASTEEVVVVAEEQKSPMAADSPLESPVKEPVVAAVADTTTMLHEAIDEKKVVNDDQLLSAGEKKALAELKQLLQDAINRHEFDFTTTPIIPPLPQPAVETEETEAANVVAVVGTEPEEECKKEAVDEEEKELVEPKEPTKEEDNGTKTVEAIEETVVSVVPPSTSQGEQEQNAENSSAAASSSPPRQEEEGKTKVEEPSEEKTSSDEVSLWGVPLFKDERTDTILWKFLRARDFKVKEAFTMIKNTLKWRKEFNIDGLLEEDLGLGTLLLEKAAFMHGVTKDGHPVCYNVYGIFQDKDVYQKMFADQEKREKFLKWRIQVMERSARKLDFRPGGISTIVQVNDLHNSPGPAKWELRQATKQALHLLQDNYPEFVAKQVFINVPWWYMAVNKMISPFLTQRTKSKFVVAGPSKSAETLFSYISPEQVPVEYGGLSKEGEVFGDKDGVTQIIIKPTCKETVEFAVTEACNLTWEVRVVGWEASYGAEFVPNATDGYTVIIQKIRKVGPTEETIITNSFKSSEPGKVALTIHNSSSKKKRLLYRLKSFPVSSSF